MKLLYLFFIFCIFSVNSFANCNKYELNNGEILQIQEFGGENFLSIFSKNFDMSFFLYCPKGTNIYAKRLNNSDLEDTDNLLKIETNSQIEKIKISHNAHEGYIKEIKFFIDDEPLSSLMKDDTFYINKDNNKDMLYQLSRNVKKESSLALNFQCTKEYFFNEYKENSLFFEYETINVDTISDAIQKWKVKEKKHKEEDLAEWFTNCQKWITLSKKSNLQELYSINKQIVIKSSQTRKSSEHLLIKLQQQAINNEELDQGVLQDFIGEMNSLKVLEKNKSKYNIFREINDVFYIRNDKDLKNKLRYILSYNQNFYYYNLLSNNELGSFSDSNSFKLNFVPIKLNIFALNKKDFLVVKITNTTDLMSQNTQFATYKLSNSFCSFLNYNIKNINKKISNKIQLVEYCLTKKFGNKDTFSSKKLHLANGKTYKRYIKEPIPTKNKIIKNIKKSICKKIKNGIFCENISKKQISLHMKNGLKIPSLDALIEDFDDEIYEGRTIYAPNNKYFFFDEDNGWSSMNETENNIIDLILTR